jgi:hypothetical protein
MKFKLGSYKNMTVITKVRSGKECTLILLFLFTICLLSVCLLHSQNSVTFLVLFLIKDYFLPRHLFLPVVVFLLIITKRDVNMGR